MSVDQSTSVPESKAYVRHPNKEKLKLYRIMRRERDARPEFLRNLWWKFAKFQNKLRWRRPRGKDNPMRLKLKGYPPVASIGYRTPKIIRGLHPSGKAPVVISSPLELDRLDPAKHAVYISSKVGLRKRMELIALARSRGFYVING